MNNKIQQKIEKIYKKVLTNFFYNVIMITLLV